ncbi:hypothetical protein AKO1_013587 [Acrasis kona]|uniref:ADP-ribosylglycohydrolase n=1 Tax=Acrasis kona TaxID=1008807 RepID=A0AAW2YV37_9EUKA
MNWLSSFLNTKPNTKPPKPTIPKAEVTDRIDDPNFFNDVSKIMEHISAENFPKLALSGYSILGQENTVLAEERSKVQANLHDGRFDGCEDRAISILLSNAIGDALGAPLEFSSVRYIQEPELTDFNQLNIWEHPRYNRFRLEPGQWTDDFSMAQCIADTLLTHKELKPIDLRARFCCWWYLGYCNAFGFAEDQTTRASVGLGGNISYSLYEFVKNPTIPFTLSGDLNTSGNGSVMRNSAIPIFYYKYGLDAAMKAAYEQSKTTHQGDEAAELCRLLTFVCFKGIQTGDKSKVFDSLETEFTSKLYSVSCLAKSLDEEEHEENKGIRH